MQAFYDLKESLWEESICGTAKVGQSPPAMCRDSRRFIVSLTTRPNRGLFDAAQQMPLVLIEMAIAVGETCAAAEDNGSEICGFETNFLDEFAPHGRLRRLSRLDAASGRIPVQAPIWIWIEQQKQALPSVE